MSEPRPLTASEVASKYGLTPRHWIRQAADAAIPGSFQPSGPGGKWLFDPKPLARWMATTYPDLETAARQTDAKTERDRWMRPRKPPRAGKPGDEVYFAYSGGLVKIGVSQNIRRRLHSFKTAAPVPVLLVGRMSGSTTLETELHRRFAPHRSHGEWFRLSDDLRQFILELAPGAGCVAIEFAEAAR